MKNYNKEITAGVLFATIVAGLFIWFVRYEPDAFIKIGIAVISFFLGAYILVRQIITKKRDIKDGAPSEDEFTKRAKLYAGNTAFFYSLYLWFLLFIFHSSFTNQEDMFSVGFLGSALIYGILSGITRHPEISMRNRIKELRARENITQAKLANLVGVRRETIVFLEKGKYNPSLNLAYSIAKVFNLAIEDVFFVSSSNLRGNPAS